MQKIRASSQFNDDESRLLTDAQKASIAVLITSDPAAGDFTIKDMYRNDTGQIVVVYDDVAVS